MYNYEKERADIFTEDGQIMFLKIRDQVKKLLKQAGAVRAAEAMREATGNSWTMLACLDRLVELKEIREITDETALGQYRVFVGNSGTA